MKSRVLRENTAKYKLTKEGEEKMCKIMEDLNKQAIKEREEEIVLNLLKQNVPLETIASSLNLTVDKIHKIQQKMLVLV